MGRLRPLATLALVPLLAVLGACGLSGTNDDGYISGDGALVSYAADDRGEPIDLTGKTLQGKDYDVSAERGKVVVVNIWGSWCGPCIREAPILQKAHEELGDKVAFVGVDVRETSADNAIAFERGNDISYPSIYSPDGRALLAFKGKVSPKAQPATLILDAEGRVAGVFSGPVPTKLTLVEAVEDVEKSGSTAGADTGSGAA